VPFSCSICEQESTRICAFCTKDSCDNHLCERCGCCSDCCECDLPLDEATPHAHIPPPAEPEPELVLTPDPILLSEMPLEPETHSPFTDVLSPAEPVDMDEV